MVTVLEGTGKFIDRRKRIYIKCGRERSDAGKKPHSVHAIESFKMQLTVVFPLER